MILLLGSIMLAGIAMPKAFGTTQPDTELTVSPGKGATDTSVIIAVSAPKKTGGSSSFSSTLVEFVLSSSDDKSDLYGTNGEVCSSGSDCEVEEIDGGNDDSDTASTSGGGIPEGTTITLDLDDLDAGTYYLFATDDEGESFTEPVEFEVVDQDDAPSVAETDDTEEAVEVSSEGDVTVDGAGFTADGDVTVYLDYVGGDKVTTLTADADGEFDETITLPELADDNYDLFFYDEDADIAAMSDDAGSTDYDDNAFEIDVEPSISFDVDSIAGEEGDSVKITGVGFAADDEIASSEDDTDSIEIDDVATSHDEVEVSSEGSFTVTVTLEADLDSDSVSTSAEVKFVMDDAGTETLSDSLPVSQPGEDGDETVSLDETTGAFDDEFTITLFNFPDDTEIVLTMGSVELGTVDSDDNGYATFDTTVPEVPAGSTTVVASIADPGISISDGFTIEVSLVLWDADDEEVDAGDYIESGDSLTVVVYGLQPFETVSVTDNSFVTADEEVEDEVESDANGTAKHTYDTDFDDSNPGDDTGDDVTITIGDFSGDTVAGDFVSDTVTLGYDVLLDPSFDNDDGDFDGFVTSQLGSGNDFTIAADELTDLKASEDYTWELDGKAQKVEVAGNVEDEFTSASDGTNPALEFNLKSSVDTGLHELSLFEDGADDSVLTIDLIVSDPDEDPDYFFSGEETTAHVTMQETVDIIIINLDEDQDDINVSMHTSAEASATANLADDVTADDNGVYVLDGVSIPETAAGYFAVTVTDDGDDEANLVSDADQLRIMVHSSVSFDTDTTAGGDEHEEVTADVGDTLVVEPYALAANTWYVVTLDGTELDDSLFYTDEVGKITASIADASEDDQVEVEVPAWAEGTYDLTVAPADDKTAGVELSIDDGAPTVGYPTVEIEFPFDLTPALEAYPFQRVEIEWNTGVDISDGDSQIIISIDDVPLTTLNNGTGFTVSTEDDESTVTVSFEMPNGEAEDLEISIEVLDGDGDSLAGAESALLSRVTGAGSLVVGVDTSDLATIKTGVSEIKVSLIDLKASITGVDNGVALLETDLGALKADLRSIGTKIDGVSGGFATLRTDLGKAVVAIGDAEEFISDQFPQVVDLIGTTASDTLTEIINTKNEVASARGDIKVLSGSLDSAVDRLTDVAGNVGSIDGSVQGIAGGVSGLGADVSELKADVSTLSGSIAGINAGVTQSQTSILVVIILALVTVILAGATLTRRQS